MDAEKTTTNGNKDGKPSSGTKDSKTSNGAKDSKPSNGKSASKQKRTAMEAKSSGDEGDDKEKRTKRQKRPAKKNDKADSKGPEDGELDVPQKIKEEDAVNGTDHFDPNEFIYNPSDVEDFY